MINVSLKQALEVSISKSKYKNQTEFCKEQGISASLLQPMKKDSPQCQWRTLNLVSSKLGISIVDFLKNGVRDE
jgi:hypothetical protein